MKFLSPAKINLRLKVEGRRPDGYHRLSMINVLCDLHDEIEINFTAGKGIKVTSSAKIGGEDADNLAYKAAERFFQTFGLDPAVSIKIAKNIPIGAGLGGGSSNAATVLASLFHNFAPYLIEGGVSGADQITGIMQKIALEIGSDVPFFFSQCAAVVKGIGENLQALPAECFEGIEFLLLLTDVHVSTAEIFSRLRERSPDGFETDETCDSVLRLLGDCSAPAERYSLILNTIENDLQSVTVSACELLSEMLSALESVSDIKVCMTGSGSAFFVLAVGEQVIKAEKVKEIAQALLHLPVRIRRTRVLRRESPLLRLDNLSK